MHWSYCLLALKHQYVKRLPSCCFYYGLTHWGRVTHRCVGKLTSIGSDNGLSPGRRQAIIWTNAGILLTGPLGTNFGEILIEIHTFSFKKMHLKMSSGKWRPFCLSLNVLTISIPFLPVYLIILAYSRATCPVLPWTIMSLCYVTGPEKPG